MRYSALQQFEAQLSLTLTLRRTQTMPIDFKNSKMFMTFYSNSKEEHEEKLKIVLQELREHQLYAKFNKCDFFKDKIQYLGHVITKEGISVDPKKIK